MEQVENDKQDSFYQPCDPEDSGAIPKSQLKSLSKRIILRDVTLVTHMSSKNVLSH